MTNKTLSKQLTVLVDAIIKNWTYPNNQELSLKEKQKLVDQLKSIDHDTNNLDEIVVIVDAFYKDKVDKQLKTMNNNLSWIFEILQHELVSATQLHTLLLNLAHNEQFSTKSINKINYYFMETSDYGDNDNFITMSSTDVLDSLERSKILQITPSKNTHQLKNKKNGYSHINKKKNSTQNKIIKLKDYSMKKS
jgi:hypothetical protein